MVRTCGSPKFKTAARSSFFASVVDFVTAKAPEFNRVQQTSTSRLQKIQQESLRIHKVLQGSTRFGTWFDIQRPCPPHSQAPSSGPSPRTLDLCQTEYSPEFPAIASRQPAPQSPRSSPVFELLESIQPLKWIKFGCPERNIVQFASPRRNGY